MAFLFTGTFTEAQFKLFSAWIAQQVPNIGARIDHLREETRRVGYVRMDFDEEGYPVSYRPMFKGSLMEKLLGAYEAQGGDLARDFRLRMMDQAVSIAGKAGPATSTQLTDGKLLTSGYMDDVLASDTMQQVRRPFIEAIKRKRESIEYRIKRTQDRYDTLNAEIVLLRLAQYVPDGLVQTSGVLGDVSARDQAFLTASGDANLGSAFEQLVLYPSASLEVLIQQVKVMFEDPVHFRSTQKTQPHDIFGLKVRPLRGFDDDVTTLSNGQDLATQTAPVTGRTA